MRGNAYTFLFMALVCVACALVVSGAASLLKETQARAERIDGYKNVLMAAGLVKRGQAISADDIEKMYKERIGGRMIDAKGNVVGETANNMRAEDVHKQDKILPGTPGYVKEEDRKYPLYVVKNGEVVEAYVMPVWGQGLWSALYGYLSIAADGKTIKNLVFYKEGETPGLGKRITEPWFQEQFEGKQYLGEDGKVTFTVGRPSQTKNENPNAVNGISGATITSRGVGSLVVRMMNRYQPYFEKVAKAGKG